MSISVPDHRVGGCSTAITASVGPTTWSVVFGLSGRTTRSAGPGSKRCSSFESTPLLTLRCERTRATLGETARVGQPHNGDKPLRRRRVGDHRRTGARLPASRRSLTNDLATVRAAARVL